eukprot:TRINITY_DN59211_c0_g1_i1.p1 TRINITY_DN59211_c0_g1~~TRINITY_DN59211_c0_g1_i1.p1  ORF type:complete len:369 (-),score=84.31 TRINITY_DN59211_c0_g1_i1:36-1142(-)
MMCSPCWRDECAPNSPGCNPEESPEALVTSPGYPCWRGGSRGGKEFLMLVHKPTYAVARIRLGLPEAVRLEVQLVHSHMISLLKADMWSQMNGISTDVPSQRLEGFEFEIPAERTCMGELRAPIAVMATPEFAQGASLLEDMEQQLGGTILEGRPALQKQDWHAVFDTVPNSWQELQAQVLRLAELAIFHAERDPYFQLLAETTRALDSTAEAKARRSRRKGKRRQSDAAAPKSSAKAQAVSPMATSLEADLRNEEREAEDEDGEDFDPEEEIDEELDEEKGKADTYRVVPRLTQQEGNFISCFEWLPELFSDGPREWQLLETRRGQAHQSSHVEVPVARAFVKNTFVEVELVDESVREPRRCKSAIF